MVTWMCGIKRERLGSDDNLGTRAKHAALVWAHAVKKDNDWVKKCTKYEVEGVRPRGRPKKTWTVVVQKDCQAHKFSKEDVMDRSRWKK